MIILFNCFFLLGSLAAACLTHHLHTGSITTLGFSLFFVGIIILTIISDFLVIKIGDKDHG